MWPVLHKLLQHEAAFSTICSSAKASAELPAPAAATFVPTCRASKVAAFNATRAATTTSASAYSSIGAIAARPELNATKVSTTAFSTEFEHSS